MMDTACKTALILAAGSGTRARSLTGGLPKCLMDLGGKPVIAWILGAIRKAGIHDVVMVTGFRAAALKQAIGDGARYGLGIRYAHNRRWREPNGLSLYAASKVLSRDTRFLVMMSDHLMLPRVIKAAARMQTSGCLLVVDTDIEHVFDISDATKVRLQNRKPVAIGKRLRKYNAVDCGLFRFDHRIFDALRDAIGAGEMSLSAGVKRLIASGDLEVMPVAGSFWIDIDTPKAHAEAARRLNVLREALREG
jgi:choline kinase